MLIGNFVFLTGLFFFVTLLVGYLSSRKETAEDFLIANRKVSAFDSVMSLSGGFIGAGTLLVYTAFVFRYGVSALWIFIGYFLGFVAFSFFGVYLKKYAKGKKFYTIGDYFKYRFGEQTALIISVIMFLWYFGTLSVQFIGGGKILMELTGFSYHYTATLMLVIMLIYLLFGGFKSVIKTDILQFLVFFILLILFTISLRAPQSLPSSYYFPFNAGAINIIAFLLLGFFTPFCVPDYWQRVFAMKNSKIVKQSFMLSGTTILFVAILLSYFGLIARSEFPGIDPDIAILQSFTQLVPEYFLGVITVIFFAAILSTADSLLFYLGINTTNDFFSRYIPSSHSKVYYTRIALIVIGVLSLIFALLYPSITDTVIIFKSLGLIISPIVLICWLSGGKKPLIIFTITSIGLLIVGLSFAGFVKPELSIIASLGALVLYAFSSFVFFMSKTFNIPFMKK